MLALLCTPVSDGGIAYSQRMVTLLIDGLRYAAELQRPSYPQVRGSTSAMRIFTKLAKPEKMAWMFDYRIDWDAPLAPTLQTARASG